MSLFSKKEEELVPSNYSGPIWMHTSPSFWEKKEAVNGFAHSDGTLFVRLYEGGRTESYWHDGWMPRNEVTTS